MGSYLNPGNIEFQESLNSKIYIDKTGLIERQTKCLEHNKNLCVSVVPADSENLWQPTCFLPIMIKVKILELYFKTFQLATVLLLKNT